MKKELLTVEFRYNDASKTKIITIGVFDTLEEAIEKGNNILAILSRSFEVRADDKFQLKHLFGNPKRLVTNTCYPTNGIQYFAKITQLTFDDLDNTIEGLFAATERYEKYQNATEK